MGRPRGADPRGSSPSVRAAREATRRPRGRDATSAGDAPGGAGELLEQLRPALAAARAARARMDRDPGSREVGTVARIQRGVALVDGLPGARSEELIGFPGDRVGMAIDLQPGQIGVVLLDDATGIDAGSVVRRSGRVLDVPVGETLLGRVVDPLGRPRDGGTALRADVRRPVERPAPSVMDRAPVAVPLQTGLKVVDALIPLGRGQRELIVGDPQTGKTAIAIDTILAQRDDDVVCVYCAIGLRSSSVTRTIAQLRDHGALGRSVVVATTGDDPAGLQYVAPYAATSIAEWFMELGRDVLVVYDDLTRHARAYREISLLLRRPPGREAFPGDIFYLHSRLLERATHLRPERGGGSLTALPIVETSAQNIAAYIPTNLISITDGQVYLSPRLFRQAILPAVDAGLSVSRVGGRAQLPAYRAVAGPLRLAYTQFQELERFSRYGARLDEDRSHALERGRRVREALKQPQFQPLDVADQVAILVAVTEGVLDEVPLERIADGEVRVRERLRSHPDLATRIRLDEPFDEVVRSELVEVATSAIRDAGLGAGGDRGDE